MADNVIDLKYSLGDKIREAHQFKTCEKKARENYAKAMARYIDEAFFNAYNGKVKAIYGG